MSILSKLDRIIELLQPKQFEEATLEEIYSPTKYIIETTDLNEYDKFYKGPIFYNCLWDLDQWLRSEIKYHDREVLQEVRDKLYEIMSEDYGVSFDL